jgi:Spy/CpxP family protein refolding chaperone
MMRGFRVIAAAVFLASVIPAAAAQRANQPPKPPAQGIPGQADPADMNPGEIQRMFDAWALVEAQDVLQLSDAQYGKFVPRMKALHDTRRRHQQARQQILAELRKLTSQPQGTTVDEAAVRDKLKLLRDEDDRAASDVRKALDGVDEVLDTSQQARFRLFEERMEARKLELLTRARANARARRGAGGR